MANNYTGLKQQHDKVRSVYERLTPPKPDDEFEALRRSVLSNMDKVEAYMNGRISGDGSVQATALEE